MAKKKEQTLEQIFESLEEVIGAMEKLYMTVKVV